MTSTARRDGIAARDLCCWRCWVGLIERVDGSFAAPGEQLDECPAPAAGGGGHVPTSQPRPVDALDAAAPSSFASPTVETDELFVVVDVESGASVAAYSRLDEAVAGYERRTRLFGRGWDVRQA